MSSFNHKQLEQLFLAEVMINTHNNAPVVRRQLQAGLIRVVDPG
jgi:hypothetical protein